MANFQQLAIIKRGVSAWNQWRQENPDIRPDLREADLRGYRFNKIDLHNTDLRQADFYRTEFKEANLREANLHMAHLYRANFFNADLRGAVMRGADLVRAKLIGAQLQNTDLRWVKMGEANLRHADLTGSTVYAVSAWEVNLDDAIQLNLDISRNREHTVTVDRLEMAQFIHMLLNYKKLRNVLNSFTERGVLLLGRFKEGGLQLLQSIAGKLRAAGYLPMIFDFDAPNTTDYTETVKTLVGLSRFVIVELSGSSVPQELTATVPFFHIPFVPIINPKRGTYATFSDNLKYPWVLSPVVFLNEEDLLTRLSSEIIQPALDNFEAIQKGVREKKEGFKEQMKQLDQSTTRAPKGEKRMEVTDETMAKLPFKRFYKSAVTRARPLTEDDYTQRNGTIQTLEGPATFHPGDYLARGAQNEEWPITRQHFEDVYKNVASPDAEDFTLYIAKDVREAYQMQEDFTVKRTNGDILSGKKGDYLVRSDDHVRIIQCNIFESTHEPVEDR